MVLIPSSTFQQGSTMEEVNHCVHEWAEQLVDKAFLKESFRQWILKEYPAHTVRLNSFYLNKYLITNEDFRDFVLQTNHKIPESIALNKPLNHPVWGIDLSDIKSFLDWLNADSKIPFRLASESEWEYAAKGNALNEYPFGNHFTSIGCNTLEAAIHDTTPIDFYNEYPSPFGIFDMAGNVEEWTSSTYEPYPNGLLITDDLLEKLGSKYPILRGGSFHRGGDLARCNRRHGPFPSSDYKYIGFRVAATP